ncbi:MAG: endonuclease [Bacilli bacterium]
MKTKKLKFLNLILLFSLFSGTFVLSNQNNEYTKTNAAVGNYTANGSTYYDSITATSGTELAAQLHDLITSTHQTYTTYADNGANLYQQNTDQYYDESGNKVSGYIYEFYSGVQWPNAWAPNAGDTTGGYNREHVWCQSLSVNTAGTQLWGETGGGADMHHLRPTEVRINSSRSNNLYGELTNRESYIVYSKLGSDTSYIGGYNDSGVFEPLDNKKGDVARIVMYVYLHYNSYTISDVFGSYATTNGSGSSSFFSTSLLSLTKIMNASTEDDAKKLLLKWNESDPVDDIEKRRNDQVQIYQGNRNPFIDNSSYANAIWGDGTVTDTPSTDDPAVESVSVSPSTLTLNLKNKTTSTLTATVNVTNDASQEVSWKSSDTNVATVDSNGEVTAISVGSAKITATSTFDTSKSASCSVEVIESDFEDVISSTFNLTIASYNAADVSTDSVTWENDFIKMTNKKNGSSTNANNYLGGDANNRTSSRFYNNQKLTLNSQDGYYLYKVEFTAASNSYATTFANSTWSSNCSATASELIVTITPNTNNVNSVDVLVGGTCGFTSVTFYVYKALTDIALDTSKTTTTFYLNSTFNYNNLIVNATYSDKSSDTVNPTSVSTPDMTTLGTKVVTVTYTYNGTSISRTYEITVENKTFTSITASTSKVFHPGEVITTSDITVLDNYGSKVSDFTINDSSSYKFVYEDTLGGGVTSNKKFTIKYNDLSTTLDVSVSRLAYEEPLEITDELDKAFTGASNAYNEWENTGSNSNVIYSGYTCGNNSSIQLNNNSNGYGIVTKENVNQYSVKKITVEWNSSTADGKTLIVYGSDTAYTAPKDLYAENSRGDELGKIIKGTSTELTIDSSKYKYIGLVSSSGVMYLSKITIVYNSPDSALNIANDIMYNDTENQCLTKFNDVINKLNTLSSDEIKTFFTSEDYVISCARERLNAWAIALGKTITYNSDSVSFIVNANNNYLTTNNAFTIPTHAIIVIASLFLLLLLSTMYVRQRKNNIN